MICYDDVLEYFRWTKHSFWNLNVKYNWDELIKLKWWSFCFKFQYLSVGHPPYYKGLDYIYEDRGEVHIVYII